MQYKTITLQLLEDRPELYDQLRSQRMLLATVERYASGLKASHEAWKERLTIERPGSNLSRIATEALELAVEELVRHLPPASPMDETEPLSLDEAMAFIRPHTPPG